MIAPVKPIYMTEKGIQKAWTELETLLKVTRPEILGYLQDAKDGGDSADNTEYQYLIQELDSVDRRIRHLEYKLKNAILIEQGEPKEAITIGTTVTVQEQGAGLETFTIVGSAEADPDQGSISDESPLGRALLNHKIGEDVVVDSPDGPILFRIVGIS